MSEKAANQSTITARANAGDQAAASPGRSYLFVIDGDTSFMFNLPRQGDVIIGRGQDAGLQLKDPAASRRHALVRCEDGRCELHDLGSHNGTRVNGERLAGPRRLAAGDVIRLSEAMLVLQGDAGAQAADLPAAAATRYEIGGRTVLVADPAMAQLFRLLDRLATSELPVLLCGETGCGKEIAALALHEGSRRRRRPFVALNCAAIPEALAEGELFGYQKGAFSGAQAEKPGLLEAAHKGTLFLDEVGELPLSVQAKLLRALETRRVVRLGDLRERAVDVRVLAATNRRLPEEVAAGRFRQDLLFRLSGATLTLPPLRDRPRELFLLAGLFLAEARARLGRGPESLSPATLERLLRHGWPGNVRELKSAMDYVASTCDEPVVEPRHLPPALTGPAAGPAAYPGPLTDAVRTLERSRMLEALEQAGGVQTRAAEILSMPLRTFTSKLRRYGLLGHARRRVRGP